MYEDGLLVSSLTTREPEFSRADRSALLAYVAHRQSIGQYGEVVEEAMSPDTDNNNRNAPYKYVASVRVNHAAAAVDAAQHELQKKFPDDPKYGHRWSVVKVSNGVQPR